MSLSARIAVGPSRRLALLSTILPIGGIVVCAATLVQRWPAAALLSIAIAACLAMALRVRHRAVEPRTLSRTLSVSHHVDFAVEPDPTGADGSWRLADSTVVWPGFALLAVRRSDPDARGGVLRLPIVTAELATADRRALSRFLLWSLRAGGADSRA